MTTRPHLARVAVVIVTAVALAIAAPIPVVAAAPGGGPSYFRIVNAIEATSTSGAMIRVDDDPPETVPWTTATAWLGTASGRHEVVLSGSPVSGNVTFSVSPGCSTTVVLTQRSPDSSSVVGVPLQMCPTTRIPRGKSRINAILATDPDVGVVHLQVGDVGTDLTPFEASLGADVTSGRSTLTVGSAQSEETYMTAGEVFEPDTAYTLLWVGGGESAAAFVSLVDGRQAASPPPAGSPIQTGLAPADGGARFGVVLAIVFVALIAVAAGDVGRRTARRPFLTAAAVLTVLMPSACRGSTQRGERHDGVPSASVVTAPSESPTSGAAPAELPAFITIPALRIATDVVILPSSDAGVLPEVLSRSDIAWISGTSELGVPGTIAFAGHTTFDRTGIFDDLGALSAGDTIIIRGTSGTAHRYVVTSKLTSPKNAFPQWIWAPQPRPLLALISCTGPAASGLHRDNLIVLARPS